MDTDFGTIRAPGPGQTLPGNLMADYITHPTDPIKALFVSSGNPVLSIGGETKMREALEQLDLMVCVDIYRNATAEYADYILPAAGAFEREDINLVGLGLQYQPSVQYTEAMVEPGYERRQDWWIWERLSQAMGYASVLDETDEPNMWARIDAMLRSRGHSMQELKNEQIIVIDKAPASDLMERVQHEAGTIDCFPAIFETALSRMAKIFDELNNEPSDQLKLISKRDAYMFNSWYANVEKLKRGKRQDNHLYMNAADAQARQLNDGDPIRVSNQYGQLQTTVAVSDELMPGVVAMTHGWGHQSSKGMREAQAKPGVNCNVLLPSGPDSFEPLSSQAHMTGINVDVVPA